jgi:hypothetical protein
LELSACYCWWLAAQILGSPSLPFNWIKSISIFQKWLILQQKGFLKQQKFIILRNVRKPQPRDMAYNRHWGHQYLFIRIERSDQPQAILKSSRQNPMDFRPENNPLWLDTPPFVPFPMIWPLNHSYFSSVPAHICLSNLASLLSVWRTWGVQHTLILNLSTFFLPFTINTTNIIVAS